MNKSQKKRKTSTTINKCNKKPLPPQTTQARSEEESKVKTKRKLRSYRYLVYKKKKKIEN